MQNNLLQKSYKSLKCRNQGHEGQPLNYVCISPQCQKSSLICYLCSQQQHKDHQKILLKSFINQLLSIQKKSQRVIPLCAKMDQIFNNIKQKIQKYSLNLENLELIFKTFQSYRILNVNYALSFSSLNQKISCLFDQTQNFKIVQKLNRFVKNQYFKFFSEIEPQQWVKLNISQKLLERKIQDLNGKLQMIQKLKNTHKLNDHEVLNLFPLISQTYKKVRINFSEDLKPSCMTLISPTQAKMQKSGTQRLLVLEPCLSKTNSVKKWGVKIVKLASWIGVGVCHINEIKKANYMFNYTNTGHGNYLISSNGYSWSSYKKQYNSKFQPFTYTTGDLIAVEYDPKEHKVRFKKQSDSNQPTYQLQVEANDDPIHPEINLTGIGDEVQLINY